MGTVEVKHFKNLWETLAHDLNGIPNTNLVPGQLENRWRELKRAYKKCIKVQNKTGQGRKYFEYVEEMN